MANTNMTTPMIADASEGKDSDLIDIRKITQIIVNMATMQYRTNPIILMMTQALMISGRF